MPNHHLNHDDAGTTLPEAMATTKPSLGHRLLKFTAALAAGLALGWGVQTGMAWWTEKTQADQAAAAVLGNPLLWQSASAKPASAALQAWLVMGSQAYRLDQNQISLPSGSRFQLRLQSPVAGELSVATANGKTGLAASTVLWSAPVNAGTTVLSPSLRLEGQRGRETLSVRVQPESGQPALSATLHLWHY